MWYLLLHPHNPHGLGELSETLRKLKAPRLSSSSQSLARKGKTMLTWGYEV